MFKALLVISITLFSLDLFIRDPNEALLDQCTQDQLLKIADHIKIEIETKRLKEAMKSILKGNLMEEGILASENPKLFSMPMASMSNFTFEQQKELMMMQMQHERDIQQKELEVEVIKQKPEQEKLKIEQYKLDLAKEGKMSASVLTDQFASVDTFSAARFDIVSNLKLLPKFNDEDPDPFFCMFERLAEARN